MTGHGHSWLCLLGCAHYWYPCYCCVLLLELILLSQEKDTLCYSLCYLAWPMDWLAVCQWFRLQAEFLKNTENSQVIRASCLLHSLNSGINFVPHFKSGLGLLQSVAAWGPTIQGARKRQIVFQIFIIFIHVICLKLAMLGIEIQWCYKIWMQWTFISVLFSPVGLFFQLDLTFIRLFFEESFYR